MLHLPPPDRVGSSVLARRGGVAASIGGALLFVGAVTSTVAGAQQPDGTVTNPSLFALYTLFGLYTPTFTI
jgi:hypothetical protein